MGLGTNAVTQFVTRSDSEQAVPATGQTVVILATNSSTGVTGAATARIMAAAKTVFLTVTGTTVGPETITLQASMDATNWSNVLVTTQALGSTVTTLTSYTTTYTDTTPWNYYRVVTVNASTNNTTVTVNF